MNVGILTWYKELNHGAVLQAYASQNVLASLGYTPYFLNYERTLANNLGFKTTLKKRMHRFLNGDYAYSKEYEEYKGYKKELFRLFRDNELFDSISMLEQHECIMVGSDMVFSLIQGYSPYMFGNGLKFEYLFSYAACSGGTKHSLAQKLGVVSEIESGLSKFAQIGCRDEETIEFVKSFTQSTNIVQNIDPVLLYGFEKEKHDWISEKWKTHSPYLLIYSYHGDMNKRLEIKNIKEYAHMKGLKIVSVGYYHYWCDENCNCDPKEFFDVFANASAVVTDTFHGTVFSIILKKCFCSIIRGNGFKLMHLLESCGLIQQIAEKPKHIPEILQRTIDFEYCDLWLENQRQSSMKYIFENLSNASALKG